MQRRFSIVPGFLFPVVGLVALLAGSVAAEPVARGIPPAPNGIQLPEGYQGWKLISVSHRIDNHSLRAIVGNDVAVNAARSGQTHPWPDGAILGKIVWKEAAGEHWPNAIAPDKFVHAEFMFKDSVKYQNNGTGWGWARWTGLDQKPYGKDAGFDQECIACHTPVKSRDWVFTTPAPLP
jgi:hypothetical protein